MAQAVKLGEQQRPPTPSATVLVVRDGRAGVEVLMLERHLDSDFVGGALVFPGGKIDPADRELPAAHRDGPDDPVADARQLGLDDPHAAVATRVAAVRETFEEAGVLLAHHRGGAPVTAADLDDPAAVAARAALIDRGPVADWHRWLAETDLVLDLGALAPWSWWVTPEGIHRRFTTRFFVVTVPPGQRDGAAHDEVEVTSSRWTTPADALAAHRQRTATVIFPTRCNLQDLAAFADAATAVAAARERTLQDVCPTVSTDAEGRPLVHHPDGRAPEHP